MCVKHGPIPAAARPKTWVCGRSLAGIAGSNSASGMDVSLLWVLCVFRQRSLRRADHSSRGVPPKVVCLKWVRLWSLDNVKALAREGLFCHWKKKRKYRIYMPKFKWVSISGLSILPTLVWRSSRNVLPTPVLGPNIPWTELINATNNRVTSC
jgi:hypothetical protein